MKALRRLTVRARFPEALEPLSTIVNNLRWSWHPESQDLLESVDPDLWRQCHGDPRKMLGEVSAERLEKLSTDRKFLRRLSDVADDLADYVTAPRSYQRRQAQALNQKSNAAGSSATSNAAASSGVSSAAAAGSLALPEAIAYFSPEFGITEVLPQYSGGLGILAGDHLKAASDLGAPIIGVGLLYRAGYFDQSLSADGWQLERYPALDPQGLPIKPVTDADGNLVKVTLALPDDRTLTAQVWLVEVGRVPLLLMDSDVEENDLALRQVTDRLYGGGAEHRLLQELLLGVGGVRAIRAYCAATGNPKPQVFHTNEGHAGFLGIERIREYIAEDGLSFDEALQAVRAGTVFTTHTPVPAGIDRFPRALVSAHLSVFPGVPAEPALALGAEADGAIFNMAHMGLRIGQRANGVSQLHGEVSREMFAGLWPNFDHGEVPISSVTNGVHAPTWMSRELIERAEQGDGTDALDTGAAWAELATISDAELWHIRRSQREQLVMEIRRRLYESCRQRGMADAELGWVNTAFDPDVLTMGFARRVPSYKRLTLMLRDPAKLKALLLDPNHPVQIVIAGKSHPADDGGKQLIAQMVAFADDPEVRHRIAFLPNYDIGMARYLYWGSDVWLNNPLRPLEACGTSGMKSALNGGLNLSIRDGWWDEWFDGENGWAIPTADGLNDPDRRDDLEARALYNLIETQVAPRFYTRDDAGVPTRWVSMVRHTITTLGPKVLATRMVWDYINNLYAPAAAAAARVSANDFAAAKQLAAWRTEVLRAWPGVRVDHVDSQIDGDPELGGTLRLRAEIELAGLDPDDVEVEAAFGTVDSDDRLGAIETVPLTLAEKSDARARFEGDVPLTRTGSFGYTVRVLPKNALLASPAELGVSVTA